MHTQFIFTMTHFDCDLNIKNANFVNINELNKLLNEIDEFVSK